MDPGTIAWNRIHCCKRATKVVPDARAVDRSVEDANRPAPGYVAGRDPVLERALAQGAK
jgi:hypothetical protein